jgi:hypothetical protein
MPRPRKFLRSVAPIGRNFHTDLFGNMTAVAIDGAGRSMLRIFRFGRAFELYWEGRRG